MRTWYLFGGLLVAACAPIFASTPVLPAMDPPPAAVATVTFHDIDPNPGVRYHLDCVVELVGTDKKPKVHCDIGAGATGKAIRLTIENALKLKKEWKCKGEGKKLTLEGWKNPKTGTFYKVKKVTFTSPDLPKDWMPKVTNPTGPIA
ncbi:MAG TPA: hypothetical protein VFG68_06035 [Fimbriiglobus sp.]|nr:hypothetical protein [Fimbriiglobus sp.]